MNNSETFSRAIFLHSSPITSSKNNSKLTKVGETFGELLLEKTKLPKNVPSKVFIHTIIFSIIQFFCLQGFLVVALDPLEKIPDLDRLDNYFIQFVNFDDDQQEQQSCDVMALGNSFGNEYLIIAMLIF